MSCIPTIEVFPINDAPNFPKTGGIYSISNFHNKKFYIGRAANFKNRWCQHRRLLRLNKHYNKHLQRAWNKYGEDSFRFVALIKSPLKEKRVFIETELVRLTKPAYNIAKVDDNSKWIVPKEAIDKNRDSPLIRVPWNKGVKYSLSEETLKVIRENRKKQVMSEATKEKHRIHGKLYGTKQFRTKEAIKKNALKRTKKIYQFSLDGSFIKEWESNLSVCTSFDGIKHACVLRDAIFSGKPLKNYYWSYNKNFKINDNSI